jgi:hypothetical protein
MKKFLLVGLSLALLLGGATTAWAKNANSQAVQNGQGKKIGLLKKLITPLIAPKMVTQKFSVAGEITSLSASELIFKNSKGESKTVQLTDSTKYYRQKQSITWDDLTVGDLVTIKYQRQYKPGAEATSTQNINNAPLVAQSVTIRQVSISKKGQITALASSTIPTTLTLKVKDVSYTVQITSQTKLIRRFGGSAQLSEFGVGDTIKVTGYSEQSLIIVAKKIQDVSTQKRWASFHGQISNFNTANQTFTITPTSRPTQTVTVLTGAKIIKASKILTFSNLQNGDWVTVSGTWDMSDNTLAASKVVVTAPYNPTPTSTPTTTPTTTNYLLSVQKASSSTGTGVVTSDLAGITCGTDCSETYASGTVIVLNAVADSGSAFTGWFDTNCSGTSTCTVNLTADATVNAQFDLVTTTPTSTATTTATTTPTSTNTTTNP